jgi:putative SOS response-associated peptidase YedK
VAPSQDIPIVRPVDDGREVAIARWGLVPFWAKDLKVGYKMINAKAETVDEKPSFRNAFKSAALPHPGRRLLRVEEAEGGEKQPYRLCLKDQSPSPSPACGSATTAWR